MSTVRKNKSPNRQPSIYEAALQFPVGVVGALEKAADADELRSVRITRIPSKDFTPRAGSVPVEPGVDPRTALEDHNFAVTDTGTYFPVLSGNRAIGITALSQQDFARVYAEAGEILAKK